jgi:hypothetical protein
MPTTPRKVGCYIRLSTSIPFTEQETILVSLRLCCQLLSGTAIEMVDVYDAV